MDEKLAEVRGFVRDYVRMRNIKRATVMEFGQLITPTAGQSSYLHGEEIRGEDPVHYTARGYSLAAAGLESLVYEKRSEEKEAEAGGGHGPSKKPKLDLTQKRPSWVKGSVSEAVRRDTGGQERNSGMSTSWPSTTAAAADLTEAAAQIEDGAVAPYRGGRGGPNRGHHYKKW